MMARCKLNPCCGETMPDKCNPPPQFKPLETYDEYQTRTTNDAPAPAPSEDPRWQQLRDMMGLDGWHDGHFHGAPNPDQIVAHIQHVANERARLMLASAPAPSGSGVREILAMLDAESEDTLKTLWGVAAKSFATRIRASLASDASPHEELAALRKSYEALYALWRDASPRGEAVARATIYTDGDRRLQKMLTEIDGGLSKLGVGSHDLYAHPAPATVEMREALERLDRLFTYPVATEINPRGYAIRGTNSDSVEFAVEIIRAALAPATEGKS